MPMEQDFEALDQFPVGMRVLAVDDDQTCLRILQTLLHHCQYHVTTTNQAQTALELLRENKNKFDLVISDVDMPDMDGFKLLELVGLEMDLPVIMLSAHSDPKYVMKGVTHGACDYLLKPVRIEELKNIWQHVVRKGKFQKKKMKQTCVSNGEPDQNSAKVNRKRKEQVLEEDAEEEEEDDDPTAQKKARLVWTPELHKKFIGAVDLLGVEQAVPKKILDLMNVDKLTRANVASHLQKFRNALKKIKDEANQQANMAVANSHYMRMGSLNGFHNHSSVPFGSGQFHGGASAMRHYSSNGILGGLNSPAGMFQHASSSSLPFSNNNGINILQGLPISPQEELQINNNGSTAFSSSLMVAPNNHLVLEGDSQSSSQGFAPHFETNKRVEHWSNDVLSNNVQQGNVHSKPDSSEWNMFCDSATPVVNQNLGTNPTSFCGNTAFGSSSAVEAELFDLLEMEQPVNSSAPMTDAQEKLPNGFMASDAGSLDDIVNSMMTQEQSQADISGGDLGYGWLNSLGTCI